MPVAELTAKQASGTAIALVLATTVGLVGASVSSGSTAAVWTVGTLVAIVALAYRLRQAPSGTVAVAMFITAMIVLSAGVPAVAVLSESRPSPTAVAPQEKPAVDPSTELRAVLAKAQELVPGSVNSIRNITISDDHTQIYLLDLTKGEQVWFQHSRVGSTAQWSEPARSSTRDRGPVFRASDIAGLDLTAASAKARDAAGSVGADLSKKYTSDQIEIRRRSSDSRLVAAITIADFTAEADPAGKLPDNLELATLDGMLAHARRLLRDNGISPDQAVLTELSYATYSQNSDAVPHTDPGKLEIDVQGGGRYGTVAETIGRFPVVSLKPDDATSSSAFSLGSVSAAGIEKARADHAVRQSVAPVDEHAISLEIGRDTSSAATRRTNAPPIVQLGLGPSGTAYYRLDGTFARAS